MQADFENALKREPVQAVMVVIMTYLTDEQRKIVYEKLGRRVESPLPTDIKKIRDEAERRYPTWPFCEKSQERFKNQELQRAHISCATQYAQRLAELGQLLMDKDGQIESLENRVKELEEGERDHLNQIRTLEARVADAERSLKLVEGLTQILEELNVPELEDAGQLLYNISTIAAKTLSEYHTVKTKEA